MKSLSPETRRLVQEMDDEAWKHFVCVAGSMSQYMSDTHHQALRQRVDAATAALEKGGKKDGCIRSNS